MLAQLPQLWLLIVFSVAGVFVGLLQAHEARQCPYCGLDARRSMTRCPHCRCRLD
jgi:hypothetical protein